MHEGLFHFTLTIKGEKVSAKKINPEKYPVGEEIYYKDLRGGRNCVYTAICQNPKNSEIFIYIYDPETDVRFRGLWPVVAINKEGKVEIRANLVPSPNKRLFSFIWNYDAKMLCSIIKKTFEMCADKLQISKKAQDTLSKELEKISEGKESPFA